MSSRFRKGMLYIRHIKPGDKCDSFMSAVGLAAATMMVEQGKRRSVYVLVRHGFPNDVLTHGYSKRAVQSNMLFSGGKGKSFKVNARTWRIRSPKAAA
ncbi:hypothetical protein HWC14_gp12 [Serratia phage Parlo]|uniref:Uncharacterized protein n=1 Tax=Serratia phage Parlo TaxID=2557554 RepID=A0A482MFH7_9CAUD|nr:hypothetical protein HWC14_gp12 [Serratia phage Parlo]QBQ72161.1 hypothetical protein CPT_Parlo_012 [Serratia phage Parlo]